ncbi:protein-L-isoaspartate(D-aspartate) O-methyltransferase [Streptomyces iconiensis]|uniref:Protein-L-isoaspartate O-methyltransferase n=1 Tax=Streptomyces iconiensis TaxID=1384038 RepID=A0ABT7A7Z2_9ACTN|nr:protein-L-isoaspartate(D-aspartate) O-methyltransferase [Streptomyces iconiensis]MDJ1137452.1 protein-L-isoaspartate(D-aspartate) O-methyltransferase [Streptomyces iconiensis]
MPRRVARTVLRGDRRSNAAVLPDTGWSTALLAHRLGEQNVVSVEVDKTVADTARERLHDTGLHPTLLVGDGLAGHPAGAPYDRIIATVGLRQIPPVLLRQLRPGGLLLAPWGSDYANQDALVKLTADGEGAAVGPFLRPLEFMKARGQRGTWPRRSDYVPTDWAGVDPPRTTRLTPQDLGDELLSPGEWALALALPGLVHRIGHRTPDEASGWWYSLTDLSWAAATWRDGQPAKVWQGGPRRLFEEVESAHQRWQDHGRPGHDRYGLTIDHHGQHTWLDHPHQPVAMRG